MINRDQIVEIARSQLNTPFKHQGRLPGVAFDCAGLLQFVLESLSLPHNDLKGYPRLPYKNMISHVLDSQPCLEKIQRSQALSGDVYLMQMHRMKEPMHIAIVTDAGIIHAYSDAQKIVEHRLPDEWIKNIHSTYRIVSPRHAG